MRLKTQIIFDFGYFRENRLKLLLFLKDDGHSRRKLEYF